MNSDRPGFNFLLVVAFIGIFVIAASIIAPFYSQSMSVYFPPSPVFSRLSTPVPSIPLPDNFVSPQIQCTGDGIIAFVPEYIINKNSTYTIEFAENTSTNHPEGLWVLRMKNKETENILVRCV